MDKKINQIIFQIKPILSKTWNEIGYSSMQQENKCNKIAAIFKDIFEETKKEKDDLILRIDGLGLEIFHLTKELKAEPDAEPEGNLSLLELEQYLIEKKEELLMEVNKRVKEFNELKQEFKDLCEILDEELLIREEIDNLTEKVPSEKSLDHVKLLIKTLQQTKDDRERTVINLASTISAQMKELDFNPKSHLERAILSEVNDYISLSNSTIKDMQSLTKELENQLKENRRKKNAMLEKLHNMWRRLDIDQGHCNSFISSLTGKVVVDLLVLQAELEAMDVERKRRFSDLIPALKMELAQLWDKCYIGEDERKLCQLFYTDEISEEVLEGLEDETKRLKEFHTENLEIFSLLNDWQTDWGNLMKLKEKEKERSKNPRQYNNRGGTLLQETNERKRINKHLPRVEWNLIEKMQQYEKEHNKPFLICGGTIDTYIQGQKDYFERREQMEKIQKHEQKMEERQTEALFGTRKVPKRTHPIRSDSIRNSKYLKVGDNERCAGTSRIQRTSSRTNLASPYNMRGAENRGILHDHANLPTIHADATLDSSHLPTYSKFSEAIHNLCGQENIRSSVTPATLRRQRMNMTTQKTPRGLPKTPGIPPKKKFLASSPATLPRTVVPRRRSLRLNGSKYKSPYSSVMQSPYSPRKKVSGTARFPTPTKLSFLL